MTASDSNVVLVTGGSGLIGRALQKVVKGELDLSQISSQINPELINGNAKWVFLSSKDGNLVKREECEAIFEKHQPTYCIHLAARVGGLFANMKYKVEFFRENTILNDNVMECCRIYKVKKLISCLSTCVFPDKTSFPIDETMIHLGHPHSSNIGYAYSKRMIDVMNQCYKDEYNCNFTSIVPSNIYGEYDNFHLEDSHVIPGLIHKCYIAKKNNTPFTIMGSGTPLRQFIFNEDLAKLILWVLSNYESQDPIILTVDEQEEVSIKDIALMIVDAMEFKGEVCFDTKAGDGQHKKTASNKKLREHLPDFRFTSMKDGMKQTVEWFVKNYDTNVRK